MVKRSRHRPFTAVTRVRFPVESPRRRQIQNRICLFLCTSDEKRTRTRFYSQHAVTTARRVRARRALRHTRKKLFKRRLSLSQSPGGVFACFLLPRLSHPCLSIAATRQFFTRCTRLSALQIPYRQSL